MKRRRTRGLLCLLGEVTPEEEDTFFQYFEENQERKNKRRLSFHVLSTAPPLASSLIEDEGKKKKKKKDLNVREEATSVLPVLELALLLDMEDELQGGKEKCFSGDS